MNVGGVINDGTMNANKLPPPSSPPVPQVTDLTTLPVLSLTDADTDFTSITSGEFYMSDDFDGFNEETRKLEAKLAVRDIEMIYQAHVTILAHTSGQPMHYRSLATQLAATRNTGYWHWERKIVNAICLKTMFTPVYDELTQGAFTYPLAAVIVEEGIILPHEGEPYEQYLEAAIEYANDPSMTAKKLRGILRELAHALAEKPVEDLANDLWEYTTHGGVQIRDIGSGLAMLQIVLPAAEAYAVKHRLQEVSRKKKQDLAKERKKLRKKAANNPNLAENEELPKLPYMGELEHETAAEILTGRLADGYQHIQGTVHVTIPAFSLLTGSSRHTVEELQDLIGDLHALSGEATLEGYGPIPLSHASAIAGTTRDWLRMFIDPHSGHIITTDKYRAPEALQQLLNYRDPTCRFMGCTRRAQTCDKDHTIPYRLMKETSPENLAHLCRSHHLAKHHAGWFPEQLGGGVIKWTSASGKEYMSYPYVPPIQPPKPEPAPEDNTPAPF